MHPASRTSGAESAARSRSTTPCPPSEQLAALIEGRLQCDAGAELERHIAQCSGCDLLVAAAAELGTLASDERGTHIPVWRRHQCLRPGATIGRYEICGNAASATDGRLDTASAAQAMGLLGVGGMGTVYRAIDPELRREVAIKCLFAGSHGSSEQARATREARCMARLSHENVLPIFDVGLARGQVFIAMHYARGGTLRRWLERRRRPWQEVVDVFLAAARGLAAAHSEGLIHRDFKPDNVLLDLAEGGRIRVYVADFGLVRDTTEGLIGQDGPASEGVPAHSSSLTRSGSVMGTPLYMAPEQHLGRRAGPQADQFAFCVALWEALYRTHPFDARDIAQLREQKCRGLLCSPPRDVKVPRALHELMVRGLDPEPSRRFADSGDLITELERIQQSRRKQSRRKPLVLAAILCGAATLFAGLHAGGLDRRPVCEASARSPHAIWTPSRAHEVRQAFHATQVGYAAQTAEIVVRQLDDYAQAWSRTYTRLCEIGDADDHFDERIHCLHRGLDRFAAHVEVVRTVTPESVANATQQVHELDAPEQCSDDRSDLSTRQPSEALDLPAELIPLRQRLDEAEALRLAGRFAEASNVGADAVALARARGAPPQLLAQALLEHVLTLGSLSRYREALAAGEEAYFAAQQSKYERLAFEAASRMAEISAHSGDLDGAQTWLRLAEVAFARTGRNREDEQLLLRARGRLAFYKRDAAEGLLAAARAVALARELEPGGEALAQALSLQAALEGEAGNHVAAVATYEKVLAIRKRYLPAAHPVILDMRLDMADHRRFLGDLEFARAEFEDVLARLESSQPRIEKLIADTLFLLSTVEPPERAVSRLQQAIGLYESIFAADDLRTINAHHVLGYQLLVLGRLSEARKALTTAASRREQRFGRDDPKRMWDLKALAELDSRHGRHSAATAKAQAAVAIARQHYGDLHESVASCLQVLAAVYLAAGNEHDGCAALTSALDIVAAQEGATVLLGYEIDWSTCLTARGRADEAVALLQPLLEGDNLEGSGKLIRARVQLELARAYEAEGQCEQAAAMAVRAQKRAAQEADGELRRLALELADAARAIANRMAGSCLQFADPGAPGGTRQ